jgi:hypothetical protein
MKRPFPRRGDILAIIIGVALFGLVGLLWGLSHRPFANAGFGPEWDCVKYTPDMEPVCHKKIAPESTKP